MPLYQNQNSHSVHLTGPDGKVLTLKSRQIVSLSEYFEVYRQRGFITLLSESPTSKVPPPTHNMPQRLVRHTPARPIRAVNNQKHAESPVPRKIINSSSLKRTPRIVGASQRTNDSLKKDNNRIWYPVSNNIGVGILSYNRIESLRRCVNSIERYSDLNSTTVFISDDGSTDPNLLKYLDELKTNTNFVVLKNEKRIGIAGNSNRLLRALSRFKYGIMLNDDIEILRPHWESFYIDGLEKTGFHHFAFRQEGVFNAQLGQKVVVNGQNLYRVTEKPHGACLAFTNHYVKTVGAFNEEFGQYGLEHVDWSEKGAYYELQPVGFYDLEGSDRYVKLHSDASSVKNKSELLNNARKIYEQQKGKPCAFTESSDIPSISVVIPFREQERSESLDTVINNIRAQKFPQIDIILVEEDSTQKIDVSKYYPIRYVNVGLKGSHEFNKSKAFNLGVLAAESNFILMHDADMLAINHYIQDIHNILQIEESCHIGATVLYANKESTATINTSKRVEEPVMERVVSYYEGGSLACHKDVYWRVGGHNEDFYGYGCEDCDFFARLSKGSKFCNHRTHNLLHLHHGRSDSFNECHIKNKVLFKHLESLTIEQRISLQRDQLRKAGYIR